MFVELSETIALAWVRYVQHGTLVQPNWRAERGAIDISAEGQDFYARLKQRFPKLMGDDPQVLLHSAELDAVGLRIGEGESVFLAAESSFSTVGEVYSNAPDTKVLKKMLTAMLVALICFRTPRVELAFLSPKVRPAVLQKIQSAWNELAAFSETKLCRPLTLKLHLLCNADYRREVIRPLWQLARTNTDATDVFLRFSRLMVACGAEADFGTEPAAKPAPAPKNPQPAPKAPKTAPNPASPAAQAPRAAKVHPEALNKLINRLSARLKTQPPAELRRFCRDVGYSKHCFGIAVPLLALPAEIPQERKAQYRRTHIEVEGIGPCRLFGAWSAEQMQHAERWLVTDGGKKKPGVTSTALELTNDSRRTQLEELKRVLDTQLRPLLESPAMTKALVSRLRDENYCQETFGIPMPLLVTSNNFPKKSVGKYYRKPITIGGRDHRLYLGWSSGHLAGLHKWLREHGQGNSQA